MTSVIYLFSDPDRTILPNGFQEESPQAQSVLKQLARRPEIALIYITGRNKALNRNAIRDFDIPEPNFAIGDVGTTLYSVTEDRWKITPS
jgi:hypothetical protein